MRRFAGLIAVALLVASQALAAEPPLRFKADAARNRALSDPTAYAVVESLSTEVGPRLAGTEAAARARDWGVATLKALGFSNVHVEAFPIPVWLRGAESAELVAPYHEPLAVIGLGRSVPTPSEGLEGPVVVFKHYNDLLAAKSGSLNGAIVVVTEAMPRSQDGMGYGLANPWRRAGASEAAKRGAIAYLVRSLATGVSREPHTGAMNYNPDAPKIPAAAISVVDAMTLDRLADRKAPIRLRLNLASTAEQATGWTVVGDIPGSIHPDQIIVIGGHLDSWDPGTGSIDDGAGIAIAVGAAHVAAGQHPLERTIRVVMFGSEELDNTNAAFTAMHKDEVPNIVAISEIDSGADNIWSVQLPPKTKELPQMRIFAKSVAPLNIVVASDPPRFSGDDVRGMVAAGAPAVAFRQDVSRYFDWHHSSEDTLDKIDPAQMNQNVAAWASFLTIVGDSDVDFRRPTRAPAPVAPALP